MFKLFHLAEIYALLRTPFSFTQGIGVVYPLIFGGKFSFEPKMSYAFGLVQTFHHALVVNVGQKFRQNFFILHVEAIGIGAKPCKYETLRLYCENDFPSLQMQKVLKIRSTCG